MKRFIYLCTFLCALLLSVMPVKAQKTQKSSTVTVEGIVVDEKSLCPVLQLTSRKNKQML